MFKKLEFVVNRDVNDLTEFMRHKSAKAGLSCHIADGKVTVEPSPDADGQPPFPVAFRGKIRGEGNSSVITGKFTNGFYFTTLMWIAAALIVARFSWSLYKAQTGNIILCAIAAVLLVFAWCFVRGKARPLKGKITGFLRDLDKK